MDIRIGEEIPQRILFELFTDIAPDSCENFRKLCGGTFTNQKGEKLTYKNTEFHRVVKGSFVQGGNLSKLGISPLAQSIFEGYFPDETFEINHTQVGLLGYCKKSGIKYSNECQFYVTTGYPLSFMDHKYVIFGRVIQEDLETLNQRPTCKVEIAECGEFDARR
ncbi:unnamed protein product [Moneuplotes crassus]|uniref:Peptidyl-prolyl cis-trans isomerase n=1 Tax=Euplotes crassus TaxID=5936 RepID=A0AAD1XQC3_EUPCR|nr:unnamed protein product [Moneuplotes crassus]